MVSLRRRSGQTISLGYDNLDRLTSKTYPAVGGNAAADNVVLGYDLLGRRLNANFADGSHNIGYAWDNAGRLLGSTAGSRTLTYQYDAAGNRTRITWPDTAFYVSTAYDALNRPTTVKELGAATLADYSGYDDLSRRVSVTLGNGTATAYNYDNQGTLAGLAHNLAGTTQDVAFGYARNQALEIITHSWTNDAYQWNGATNGTRNYSANGLNQYSERDDRWPAAQAARLTMGAIAIEHGDCSCFTQEQATQPAMAAWVATRTLSRYGDGHDTGVFH